MDRRDKHQLVRQYVERQKAYLPTYTTEQLWNERHVHGTPSRPRRGGDFGFDTPVLRPRVPVKRTSSPQLAQQAGPSKSRTHATLSVCSGAVPATASETRPLSNKDKARSKRKKAPTPSDGDNERTARLADRRERKRKKRDIVNPPERSDDGACAAAPKKGRGSRKAKKPAGLALLYGFSATNVTKDRLTLKPAPSLGVFSKGRASAKKQATAARKSSSREVFSETAFLNKPDEETADYLKVDDDSDDRSVSIISNDHKRRVTRVTKPTKKGPGDCTESTTLKAPQTPTHAAAESDVWDIELQSKLPSSVGGISSEPEARDSAPVVLDVRGAGWTASFDVADKPEERRSKTWTGSLSVTRSFDRSAPWATSDPDEPGHPHAVDPSIHPSHSASQVGRRAADTQSPDVCQVISKYFTEPTAALEQEFVANNPWTLGTDDGLTPEPTMDARREASLVHSPSSVAQPVVAYQTWYYVAPLEFSSDDYAQVHLTVDSDCVAVESEEEPVCQGTDRDLYGSCSASDDVMSCPFDPLGSANETNQDELDVAAFLQGRALLLGVGEWPRDVGLSGLAQAEMDVANRLRGHWRPQRLS